VIMANEVINETELLERLEGDEELLHDLIDTFLAESGTLLQQVLDAVARQDGPALYRSAHQLKGTVSIFGGREATQSALALETMGREQILDKSGEAAARLEEHMAALEKSLACLKEKHAQSPGRA